MRDNISAYARRSSGEWPPFEYYTGTARDIHGSLINPKPSGTFEGVAIDPGDPPVFESQASYLERHGLFLPGERKRLKKEDFEPEVVA
jgi:hypothetical protein